MRAVCSARFRRQPSTQVKPSVQVAGSGADPFTVTPSSSENGGTPAGVPIAKNDSTSVLLVGINVITSCFQPVKPWLELCSTGVNCDTEPRLTRNCSVVPPV